MIVHNSSVWLVCAPFVALTMVAIWSFTPSNASESRVPSVDLADVYRFSDDPDELHKTWEEGYVFVPGAVIGEFIFGKIGSDVVRSRLAQLPKEVHYPIVIYLHDAGGISVTTYRLQKALEIENFAMVLPNSFARNGRKPDCEGRAGNPENCAMAPVVYLERRSELVYAVNAAKRLSWVDQDNVFLMGSGEGAVAVALWGGEVDVSGYIIANWTCTAPDSLPWFDGLRIPRTRPILALKTSGSRWSDMPGWEGDCADRAKAGAEIESLEIDSSDRDVMLWPQARRAFIEFLYVNRRSPVTN